jgi:hypothetical protein
MGFIMSEVWLIIAGIIFVLFVIWSHWNKHTISSVLLVNLLNVLLCILHKVSNKSSCYTFWKVTESIASVPCEVHSCILCKEHIRM